jgi:hypothetical protein
LTAANLDCESALYHVPNLPRAKRIQQQANEQKALNEAALRKDYYKILGLERRRLSREEIDAAFEQMKERCTPEKLGNSDRAQLLMHDIEAVNRMINKANSRHIAR